MANFPNRSTEVETMNSARQQAIAAGIIRPVSATDGDPTPNAWVEKPTLRLDRIGLRASLAEREFVRERTARRRSEDWRT